MRKPRHSFAVRNVCHVHKCGESATRFAMLGPERVWLCAGHFTDLESGRLEIIQQKGSPTKLYAPQEKAA